LWRSGEAPAAGEICFEPVSELLESVEDLVNIRAPGRRVGLADRSFDEGPLCYWGRSPGDIEIVLIVVKPQTNSRVSPRSMALELELEHRLGADLISHVGPLVCVKIEHNVVA
jgi:hypothetical protein